MSQQQPATNGSANQAEPRSVTDGVELSTDPGGQVPVQGTGALGGPTALFPRESIKLIAESLGMSDLREDLAAALASDVEYRLREIIQEATKFMKHGKRQILLPDDISHALRIRNVEPLFGYGSTDVPVYRRVQIPGSSDIYFVHDEEIDLEDVVNAPLPKRPPEITIGTHWLAVEGVQPLIPHNPVPEDKSGLKSTIDPVLPSVGIDAAGTVSGLVGAGIGSSNLLSGGAAGSVKRVLTAEQRLYYTTVVDAIQKFSSPESSLEATVSDEPTQANKPNLNAVLATIASETGLQILVPYLVSWVVDVVTKNTRNLAILDATIGLVRAMFDNPHIFIDPYLHQLMPALLTCIVGRRLCDDPDHDDHFSLRDRAANLLGRVVSAHGGSYRTLVPRTAKTLLRALIDNGKSIGTRYGAVRGIAALGKETVANVLMPNLRPLGEIWAVAASARDRGMLLRAVTDVIGEYLKSGGLASTLFPTFNAHYQVSGVNSWDELFGNFGEALLPFVLCSNPSTSSINKSLRTAPSGGISLEMAEAESPLPSASPLHNAEAGRMMEMVL